MVSYCNVAEKHGQKKNVYANFGIFNSFCLFLEIFYFFFQEDGGFTNQHKPREERLDTFGSLKNYFLELPLITGIKLTMINKWQLNMRSSRLLAKVYLSS
jgi:hypothetical protein